MTFIILHLHSVYNAILSHPGLNLLNVIISMKHLLIHFLTSDGVGEMRGDQQLARKYFQMASKLRGESGVPNIDYLNQRELEIRGEPVE